jgi:hypothetical protein
LIVGKNGAGDFNAEERFGEADICPSDLSNNKLELLKTVLRR